MLDNLTPYSYGVLTFFGKGAAAWSTLTLSCSFSCLLCVLEAVNTIALALRHILPQALVPFKSRNSFHFHFRDS